MAETKRSILFYAECSFVVLACLFLLVRESLLPGGVQAGNQSGDGNLPNQAILFLLFGVSFLIACFTNCVHGIIGTRNLPLHLLLMYICASALWSEEPSVVIRRAVALVGTTVFGAYLALRLRPTLMAHLLAIGFGIVAISSLAAVFTAPGLAIHHADEFTGDWKGILGFKNSLGQTMALGFVVCMLAANVSQKHVIWRFFYFALAAVCILLVVGSASGTSIVGIAVLGGLMLPLNLLVQGGGPSFKIRLLAVGSVAIFTPLWFAAAHFDAILALLGKTPTLTGRTLIWNTAIQVGMEHHWFGEGYRAFWVGPSADKVYSALSFRDFGHAHNSFVDVWLELGWVGLGLMGMLFAAYLARAIQALRLSTSFLATFPMLILVYMLVFGLTSRIFPQQGSMIWVLFIMSWVMLAERSYLGELQRGCLTWPAALVPRVVRA